MPSDAEKFFPAATAAMRRVAPEMARRGYPPQEFASTVIRTAQLTALLACSTHASEDLMVSALFEEAARLMTLYWQVEVELVNDGDTAHFHIQERR